MFDYINSSDNESSEEIPSGKKGRVVSRSQQNDSIIHLKETYFIYVDAPKEKKIKKNKENLNLPKLHSHKYQKLKDPNKFA